MFVSENWVEINICSNIMAFTKRKYFLIKLSSNVVCVVYSVLSMRINYNNCFHLVTFVFLLNATIWTKHYTVSNSTFFSSFSNQRNDEINLSVKPGNGDVTNNALNL